uniref:GATOR complex protein WDR24 n=1 Tax=Rhabditophanes sp. KR3021 TaxID=114890 RepID=A0AC35TIY4_9BILA
MDFNEVSNDENILRVPERKIGFRKDSIFDSKEPFFLKNINHKYGEPIESIITNSNYSKMVVGSKKGLLKVYDISQPDKFMNAQDLRTFRQYRPTMYLSTSLSWNKQNENKIVSNVLGNSVVIFDLEANYSDRLFPLSMHQVATKVSFHDNNKDYLLIGFNDGLASIVDLRTDGTQSEYRGAQGSIRDVKFDPNPDQSFNFVTADDGGFISIWDLRYSRSYYCRIPTHRGSVSNVAYHMFNKNLIASCGADKTIRLTNIYDNGKQIAKIDTLAPVQRIAWTNNSCDVWKICASYNNAHTEAGRFYIWDFEQPSAPWKTFELHDGIISDIIWPNSQSKYFFTAGKDGFVKRNLVCDGENPSFYANKTEMCHTVNEVVGVVSKEIKSLAEDFKRDLFIELSHEDSNKMAPKAEEKHSTLFLMKQLEESEQPGFSSKRFECYATKWRCGIDSKMTSCDHNAKVCYEYGDSYTGNKWESLGLLLPYFFSTKDYRRDLFFPEKRMKKKSRHYFDRSRLVHMTHANNISGFESDPELHMAKTLKKRARDQNCVYDLLELFHFPHIPEYVKAYEAEDDHSYWDITKISDEAFDDFDPNLIKMNDVSTETAIERLRRGKMMKDINLSSSDSEEDEAEALGLRKKVTKSSIDETSDLIKSVINFHSISGDVQFLCTFVLMLGEVAEQLVSKRQIEAWFYSYIDLLRRHRLTNIAAYFVKYSINDNIKALSQAVIFLSVKNSFGLMFQGLTKT